MHFPQELKDLGHSPLLSQERLDALTMDTKVPVALEAVIDHWSAKLRLATKNGEVLKESEHERTFVTDIFERGLGYRGPSHTSDITLRPQFPTASSSSPAKGKPMDAALGRFESSGAGSGGEVAVVVECKGTDSDLEIDRRHRGMTPPEQAFSYAATCREGTPKVVIVTNLREIRLYRFEQRIARFWRFDLETFGIETPEARARDLRELAYLLAPERLLPEGAQKAILDLQLEVAEEAPKAQVTAAHAAIEQVIEGFQSVILDATGAGASPSEAIQDLAWAGGQRIVARMLFTGFANKHGLLQPGLLSLCQKQAKHPLNKLAKWDGIMHLFRAMDTGFSDGQRVVVPHFNGGLFKLTAGVDDLKPKPGAALDHVIDDAFELARNADLDSGSTLLGQIFEQGLKRFESRTLKQVQDGIVYTPEHICRAVSIHTLEPLVQRQFAIADVSLGSEISEELLPFWRFRRRWDALASLRIIDPACGSGAFLAAALHYLKFVAMDQDALLVRHAFASLPEAPVEVQGSMLEAMEAMEAMEGGEAVDPSSLRGQALAILHKRLPMENALFGVDLHGEAVTYAKLSVWLKGVERADILQQLEERIDLSVAILPNLDEQIVEGDSLVGRSGWYVRFPAVMAQGGFDAVIGNPPYVKIQDLKDKATSDRIKATFPDVAKKSFDLYIPFVDLGLRTLLCPHGRMGFIAPSLWSLTDYGMGLRKVIHEGKHLEAAVHFRTHQVFDGVLTYTGLWFFTTQANPDGVKLLDAPAGIKALMEGGNPTSLIVQAEASNSADLRLLPWSELNIVDPGEREAYWPLWAARDTAIRDKVTAGSVRLEDFLGWATQKGGAFQGVVTGMNQFFHVEKAPQGDADRFVSKLEPAPAGFPLETGLVRQLLDADSVDRYAISDSGAKAIFPYYLKDKDDWELIDLPSFPLFESYAKRHRKKREKTGKVPEFQGLENRDGGDHKTRWWEFSRAQNLSLQCGTKLVFPTTVKRLAFALDDQGRLQDHMRVYGLTPRSEDEGYFLLGVLNSRIATWFAKRVSAPKSGGYFEAIDTYLRKYPIPNLADKARATLIAEAKKRHGLSAKLASAKTDNERIKLTNEAGKAEAEIDAILQAHYELTDEEWDAVKADG